MLATAYVLLALYGSGGAMYQDAHMYAAQSSCETALQDLENIAALEVSEGGCFAVSDQKSDKSVLFVLVGGQQLVRVGTYHDSHDCAATGKKITTAFPGEISYGCTPNLK